MTARKTDRHLDSDDGGRLHRRRDGLGGSVVVNRLSADPGSQVVVLEAGPPDKDKFIHIPLTWAVKLFRSAVDWDDMTEPQKELNGRQIYWPRGKMLGGSSSMNAQMWVRGFAADYDEWGELAGDQWSFDQVAPYFDRIEAGPLVISPQRCPRSSTAAWLAAAKESGYRVEPPNTDAPERFCQTMVTQRRGARGSCADAYLKPVLRRRNLTLLTEATATSGAVRWDPRRRGRIRARRSAASDAGASRGGAVRRRHQQPAAADALRHRGSRAARRTRHRLRAGRSSTRTRSSILCARSESALPQSTSTTSSHCQPTTRCGHCLTRCSPDTSHTSPTTSTGPSTKTPLRTSPPSGGSTRSLDGLNRRHLLLKRCAARKD